VSWLTFFTLHLCLSRESLMFTLLAPSLEPRQSSKWLEVRLPGKKTASCYGSALDRTVMHANNFSFSLSTNFASTVNLVGCFSIHAGLKAVYLSGWQVAADANTALQTYPDQSLYPCDSVPKVRGKFGRGRSCLLASLSGRLCNTFLFVF